jgi:hypothetical protein
VRDDAQLPDAAPRPLLDLAELHIDVTVGSARRLLAQSAEALT